jgi:hypothetical protein
MATKGSLKWLREIAKTLGLFLLGIELHDHRHSEVSVSPAVQVRFVVPMFYDEFPREIQNCHNFEGHRGNYLGRRGKGAGKSVYFVTFDFYQGPFPSVDDVLKVAQEFGLTVREPWLNTEGYTQCADPKLYR